MTRNKYAVSVFIVQRRGREGGGGGSSLLNGALNHAKNNV